MKLKKLEVSSFGGINPASPVVIDFTRSKQVKVDGDNATGKSSLLTAMLVACGYTSHTGKEGKNFINNDTDKIDINFEFVGNDRKTYEVRCTKSSFKLTYDGSVVAEPIAKMKELLGVAGVSPMEIKNKPLKEVVRWLSSYSNKTAEEFEGQLQKYKTLIKTARDTRAAANKSVKGITEYLDNEPMYADWEGSEKKYTKEINIEVLSKELKVAGEKSDKYIRAEERLKKLKQETPGIEDKIKSLEEELAREKEKLITNNDAIATGEAFLKDNKSFKTDYDEVRKRYDNAAQESINYNKWQEIKKKKSEKDEFENISIKADAKEKEILKSVKELQAEILPDIKGVELVTEDTHEDGGVMKKEGLYWDGRNIAQLSESEWWTLVLMIWRKYKVKIVVIDNYQSLGSMAVESLTKLANDGAYILAAEMSRDKKVLEVVYE